MVRRPHIHTRSILVWEPEVAEDYNELSLGSNLELEKKQTFDLKILKFKILSGSMGRKGQYLS